MKSYSSFLVRCWLIPDESNGQRSVFDVEHIQTGDHCRVTALTEAQEWMLAACRNAQPSPSERKPASLLTTQP